MTEHYFSQKPQTASHPKNWETHILGKPFMFKTDDGVFAKHDLDFGSRLLIECFQYPDYPGRILDMGCGYGPVGLAIAAGDSSYPVLLTDINERAVHLAKYNASYNKLSHVNIQQSDLFSNIEGHFASIVTNPPIRAGKKVIYQLFTQAYDFLCDDGDLWIVIRKQQGALSALRKLEEIFAYVETVEKKKGYFIIRAKKV